MEAECIICGHPIKRVHMHGYQSVRYELSFVGRYGVPPDIKTVEVCRTCNDDLSEVEYRQFKVF